MSSTNQSSQPEANYPESMSLESMNITDHQKAKLKELFPEVFTEGLKIDFEQLKRTLGEMIDGGKERFGMNWAGKADCFKTIQQPSVATLVPVPEESIDFDTTENVFIEGDNLEVLKLLQKSYLGKIKMIYIDPPYNTGNDFIYPDNYSENLDTYLEYTGQIDGEGRKFSTNVDTDGRFHSKWMNMMYPRLFLAKNLLREDGVIFISIDDSEVNNLTAIMNEIFGQENFVANLIWEKGRKNDAKLFSIGHDYMLVYAKSKNFLNENKVKWREVKPGSAEIQEKYLQLKKKFGSNCAKIQSGLREFYSALPKTHPSKKLTRYGNVDERGVWRDDNMSWPGGGGPNYDVLHPVTGKPCKVPEGGWRYSTPEKMQEMILAGRVQFRADHTEPPIRKTYLISDDGDDSLSGNEEQDADVGIQVAGTYFYRSALQASNTMLDIFGAKVFDSPKDHEVLSRWIKYVCGNDKSALVLDFFAGSATTAHAVLATNNEDSGTRKFVCVQLPEPTNEKSEAFKAGYTTIAEISKERIRRASAKIKAEAEANIDLLTEEKTPLDLGFRVFKLQKSNFKVWDATLEKDAANIQLALEAHIDHIDPNATQQAILFELLLKAGFELTTPIETLTLANKTVFSIAEGALLLCLEKELTPDLIKAIADLAASQSTTRVIVLDEGFQNNDQLKTNASLTLKAKGVVDFRTV